MSSLWSSFPYTTLIWVVVQFGFGAATNAAVIVRESGVFFTALFGTIGQYPIDFDGNGIDDIAVFSNLYAYESSGAYALAKGSAIFVLPNGNSAEVGWLAAPVRFGEMISTLSEPWSNYGALWGEDFLDPLYGRAGSEFYGRADRGIIGAPPIEVGYLRPGDRFACGVRFLGEDGLYRYGWIDIEMNWVTALTIHGWAYETEPNVLVKPFQIPEPSNGLLCMLAGSLLVFKRRV